MTLSKGKALLAIGGEENYKQAHKCFSEALNVDPDNTHAIKASRRIRDALILSHVEKVLLHSKHKWINVYFNLRNSSAKSSSKVCLTTFSFSSIQVSEETKERLEKTVGSLTEELTPPEEENPEADMEQATGCYRSLGYYLTPPRGE